MIWQPANVATPATAAFDSPPVHERMPAAGPVALAIVTVEVLPVTVLPNESWMAIAGCVERFWPSPASPGCATNPSLFAAPTVIVKLEDVSLVSPARLA